MGTLSSVKLLGLLAEVLRHQGAHPDPTAPKTRQGCGGSAPWERICSGDPTCGVCLRGFRLQSRDIEAELRTVHKYFMPIPTRPCPFPNIHAHGGMRWELQHPETGHVWGRGFGPGHGTGLLMVSGVRIEI